MRRQAPNQLHALDRQTLTPVMSPSKPGYRTTIEFDGHRNWCWRVQPGSGRLSGQALVWSNLYDLQLDRDRDNVD